MQLLFSARETIATLVKYKCKTFITLTPDSHQNWCISTSKKQMSDLLFINNHSKELKVAPTLQCHLRFHFSLQLMPIISLTREVQKEKKRKKKKTELDVGNKFL